MCQIIIILCIIRVQTRIQLTRSRQQHWKISLGAFRALAEVIIDRKFHRRHGISSYGFPVRCRQCNGHVVAGRQVWAAGLVTGDWFYISFHRYDTRLD